MAYGRKDNDELRMLSNAQDCFDLGLSRIRIYADNLPTRKLHHFVPRNACLLEAGIVLNHAVQNQVAHQ